MATKKGWGEGKATPAAGARSPGPRVVDVDEFGSLRVQGEVVIENTESTRSGAQEVKSKQELGEVADLKSMPMALPTAEGIDLSVLTASLARVEEVQEADRPWDFDTLLAQLQKTAEEERQDHGGGERHAQGAHHHHQLKVDLGSSAPNVSPIKPKTPT